MSNSSRARRTAAEVAFGGVDITESIKPYLLSITYTDNEEDEADDLQIKLQDRDGIWMEDWLANAVDAAAEDTGLADSSVDFVTAAQAFHWFDKARFQAECRRILKPGGKVIILYNNRVESPIVLENAEINRTYCPNFKGFSGGTTQTPEAFADFFKGGHVAYKTFGNPFFLNEDGFVGRSLSSSYAPKAGDKSYGAYVAALHALFRKYAENGRVPLPYETCIYYGEV